MESVEYGGLVSRIGNINCETERVNLPGDMAAMRAAHTLISATCGTAPVRWTC